MSLWEKVDSSWAPTSSEVAVDSVGPSAFGKCAVLISRPNPKITNECINIVTKTVPESLEPGTVLVQHLLISMDPTHIIWMSDIPQYMPAIGLNTVVRAGVIGRVIKTTDEEKMPVGKIVSVMGGVAEFSVQPFAACNPTVPDVPLSWNHGPFSLIMGHTAWVGYKICRVTPGCTFLVSGAAGAVGSIAGQLAKAAGAKVIGIAGGAEKCRYITQELGFDGAIDYKAESIADGIAREAPEGIDCYFDNVGGSTLEAALAAMNCFGRIAFCGGISQYEGGIEVGPKNYNMILMRRLKVQGFIVVDHLASVEESFAEMGALIKENKLKWKEDIREVGVEDYVDTINLLFTGGNTGKLMIKLGE